MTQEAEAPSPMCLAILSKLTEPLRVEQKIGLSLNVPLRGEVSINGHQSEPVAPTVSSPPCETFKDSPIFCATLKIGKKRTGHAAGHCPGV